jgi:IMP cyclohydrolase
MGRLPMFKKNERVYCVECGSWMAAPSGGRVHGLRCASEGCESVLLPHESRQAAHAAMVGASTAEGEAQGAADGPAAPAPTTNKRKRVQEAHPQPTEPPRKKTVGVAWLAKRKKWQACIHWKGAPRDTIYLGYFDTEAAAAAVYKEARDAREAGQPLPPHLRKSKVKTSQYVGVSRMKNGNFTAVILHDGKQHHIGTYETEEQAKAAYDRVKAEIAATNTFTRDVKVASSAYRGVSFRASKGSWLASLQVDKKKTFCGWHKTEVEAAMAYDEAAKRHGLTHKLNFTSKSVGVAWLAKRKKWQACIHWKGAPRDHIYLGYFDTEAAAAAVYKEARDAREAGQPLPPHLRKSKVKTSQYVGVSRMKNGNFTAVILHDGKQHHIGTYETEEQAKAAYDRVKAEIAATNTFTRDVKVASSAYRGVSFRASKGSWLASLQVDKKKTFCGWHKTEVEAAMAYDEAAKRHGLTHKLNFTTAAQVKVAAAAAAATTSASSSNSRSSPTVKRRRVLQPPAAAAATSLSAASAAYHEALGGGYQGGHTRGGYTRGFYHGGFQLL